MTHRATSLVAIAAGCLFAGAAMAQQSPSPSATAGQGQQPAALSGASGQSDQQFSQALQQIQQDKDKAADKLFLLNTAIDSQFEVQLSQQVEQKTQDQHVKRVAQQIVRDHTQANQELMQTAQKLGLQIPQALPQMKQDEIQILTSLPEQEMDKQYIACMQAGHAKAVTAFQTVSQTAKDESVKQFAAATLPKLQQHMMHVQQAAMALGLPDTSQAVEAGYRQSGNTSGRGAGAAGSSPYGTGSSSSGAAGTGTSGSGYPGSSSGTSGTSGTGSSGASGSQTNTPGSPGSPR